MKTDSKKKVIISKKSFRLFKNRGWIERRNQRIVGTCHKMALLALFCSIKMVTSHPQEALRRLFNNGFMADLPLGGLPGINSASKISLVEVIGGTVDYEIELGGSTRSTAIFEAQNVRIERQEISRPLFLAKNCFIVIKENENLLHREKVDKDEYLMTVKTPNEMKDSSQDHNHPTTVLLKTNKRLLKIDLKTGLIFLPSAQYEVTDFGFYSAPSPSLHKESKLNVYFIISDLERKKISLLDESENKLFDFQLDNQGWSQLFHYMAPGEVLTLWKIKDTKEDEVALDWFVFELDLRKKEKKLVKKASFVVHEKSLPSPLLNDRKRRRPNLRFVAIDTSRLLVISRLPITKTVHILKVTMLEVDLNKCQGSSCDHQNSLKSKVIWNEVLDFNFRDFKFWLDRVDSRLLISFWIHDQPKSTENYVIKSIPFSGPKIAFRLKPHIKEAEFKIKWSYLAATNQFTRSPNTRSTMIRKLLGKSIIEQEQSFVASRPIPGQTSQTNPTKKYIVIKMSQMEALAIQKSLKGQNLIPNSQLTKTNEKAAFKTTNTTTTNKTAPGNSTFIQTIKTIKEVGPKEKQGDRIPIWGIALIAGIVVVVVIILGFYLFTVPEHERYLRDYNKKKKEIKEKYKIKYVGEREFDSKNWGTEPQIPYKNEELAVNQDPAFRYEKGQMIPVENPDLSRKQGLKHIEVKMDNFDPHFAPELQIPENRLGTYSPYTLGTKTDMKGNELVRDKISYFPYAYGGEKIVTSARVYNKSNNGGVSKNGGQVGPEPFIYEFKPDC